MGLTKEPDYVNGPTGPKFKNLARKEICQNEGICIVQPSIIMEWEEELHHGKWDEGEDWEIPSGEPRLEFEVEREGLQR